MTPHVFCTTLVYSLKSGKVVVSVLNPVVYWRVLIRGLTLCMQDVLHKNEYLYLHV